MHAIEQIDDQKNDFDGQKNDFDGQKNGERG